MTSAHRDARRSQADPPHRASPATAANDQAGGWKIVGRRRRTARRPAIPAFDECRCTRSDAVPWTSAARRAASAGVDALPRMGARVLHVPQTTITGHGRCVAHLAAARADLRWEVAVPARRGAPTAVGAAERGATPAVGGCPGAGG